MRYDDTKFSRLFFRYGGWKAVLGSSDFVVALIVGAIATVAISYKGLGPVFISISTVPFLTISAAMIATALAGLSIISSISDASYVKFARRTQVGTSSVYENVIFVFWFAAIIAFASLFVDLAGALVVELDQSQAVSDFFAGLMLFFLLYAVLAVALLLGVITRWGIFRGMFIAAGSPEHPDEEETRVRP